MCGSVRPSICLLVCSSRDVLVGCKGHRSMSMTCMQAYLRACRMHLTCMSYHGNKKLNVKFIYINFILYSQIPLSRAPLTRENQLVALAPWTPNFSDMPLATAHMTDPVTNMCWSEQISPLAHTSQATWQHFNLSHCIEMHNTHLVGSAGQLSQTYFTHSAPILTPRNLPPTVNKQWSPSQESCMSRHTRFNNSRKTETAAMHGTSIFLGTNSLQVETVTTQLRIWPN